jgi:hypothetical protein
MRSIVLPLLTAAAAVSLVVAAPASADYGGYLHALQDTYTSLSTQQLLSEGTKICTVIRGGMNSTNAVQMVQRDLGVSVPAADDMVAAAVVHLGC